MQLNKLRKNKKLWVVIDLFELNEGDIDTYLSYFDDDPDTTEKIFRPCTVVSRENNVIQLDNICDPIVIDDCAEYDTYFTSSVFSCEKIFFNEKDAINFFNDMMRRYQERHNNIIKMCYYGQSFYKDIDKLGILGTVITIHNDSK